MFMAFRLKNLHSFKGYLSDHIVNIVSKNKKYEGCVIKLEEVMRQNHENNKQLKSKLNMMFNIYSLPEAFTPLHAQLSQLVLEGVIKQQGDLDKVVAWVYKQIKHNADVKVNKENVVGLLTQCSGLSIREEIETIMKDRPDVTIAELCKQLREKESSMESKAIYQVVQEYFKQHGLQEVQSQHQFWDKLNNLKPRLLSVQCNKEEVSEQHRQITGGKLRFRFPPEPNGYLHIGHIKAMRINFETAKRHGGLCYLRYDDTNPATQSHEYIEEILRNVRWLGYEPHQVTFASDYFPQMINFAVKLVKDGHAYVCDTQQEEIEEERKNKKSNRYRNRPIQQSLRYFPQLQKGQTLRLKLNPQASNPTLRDPIIYRVKQMQHPRTKNKYRIYPIYDFAHCICDSLEHIDYSLCSLEFEIRRELYYTILDKLGLYKPYVWEYSRLNVEGSLISKRKIKGLIDQGVINSWGDPRLLTIKGMINRGYTSSMLISFIDKVNSSRKGNENMIKYSLLQKQMKKQLLSRCKNTMAVLQPRLISIIGQPSTVLETNEKMSSTTLSKKVYIEQSDQLTQGQFVILKYAGVFSVSSITNSIQLKKQHDMSVGDLKQKHKRIKILHWISEEDAVTHSITIYDNLLDQKQQLKPCSQRLYLGAKINKEILNNKEGYWQLERIGFFKFLDSSLISCTLL